MELNSYKKTIIYFLVLCVSLSVAVEDAAAQKLKVCVTNYPLKYFAERIGGEKVEVLFPVPPGLNPLFWMPDETTLAAMQDADMIILNGAGYEKWLNYVSFSPSRLVDTSVCFNHQYIKVPGVISHSHGSQGDHSHTVTRCTTWLDFQLASKQATVIKDALVRRQPELKSVFESNLHTLNNELMELDTRFRKICQNSRGQTLLSSQPVYDYFARRYSLNLINVLWSPEVMPSPFQWKEFESIIKDRPVKWVIWENRSIRACEEKLKVMGTASLVFNPCSTSPEKGDFIQAMHQNADNLSLAFGCSGQQ